MAFIVEMIHGRLNKLEVNKNGKIYLGGKDDDYAFFSYAGSKWDAILAIAKKFGWKPMGSVLNNTVGTTEPIKSDYKPSSWNQEEIYKLVLADDALTLSNVLQAFIEYDKKNTVDFKIKKKIIMASSMSSGEYEQCGKYCDKKDMKAKTVLSLGEMPNKNRQKIINKVTLDCRNR